jgi:hypothetical protein
MRSGRAISSCSAKTSSRESGGGSSRGEKRSIAWWHVRPSRSLNHHSVLRCVSHLSHASPVIRGTKKRPPTLRFVPRSRADRSRSQVSNRVLSPAGPRNLLRSWMVLGAVLRLQLSVVLSVVAAFSATSCAEEYRGRTANINDGTRSKNVRVRVLLRSSYIPNIVQSLPTRATKHKRLTVRQGVVRVVVNRVLQAGAAGLEPATS